MSDEPIMAQCFIAEGGADVTSPVRARELAALLMGSPRQVEPVFGSPGTWLVEFTEEEAAQLRIHGLLMRDSGSAELTAEMP